MIILHSAQLDTGLFLWAEEPPSDEPATWKKGPGRWTPENAPDYPYCAEFDRVARTVRNLNLGFRPTRRRYETALAWLPSRGRQPYASSELIAEAPESRAQLRLAPWRVEGLLLTAREAFQVLSAFNQRDRSVQGLVNGRDLSYFIEALRFAGTLVSRQRYLPTMVREARRWHARFRPVVLDDDVPALDELARRMPAIARALSPEDPAEQPTVPADVHLRAYLRAVLDQIVRGQGGLVNGSGNGNGAGPVPRYGNVHDAWLRALRGEDSRVPGRAAELRLLHLKLEQWWKPLQLAMDAPIRLCFQLDEPSDGLQDGDGKPRAKRKGRGHKKEEAIRPRQRRWHVRFLLQGAQDPDLLVSTTDAWLARGRKAASLSNMGVDLHETLLSLLGQAAGVCPRIAESLHARKPSGFSLDARGAHEFLTQDAPALQQSGFTTTLPDWWIGDTTQQRLSVRARVRILPRSGGQTPSLEEIQAFDWEICVGGQPLSEGDLEQLARLKEPLQLVRGYWVETSAEEILAAQEFFNSRHAGAVTGRELVRLALGRADRSAGIRFDGVIASGWMEALLTQLQDKEQVDAIAPPLEFTGTLRPYQERGYAWLDFLKDWGFGACLADDMGLGKTIQTLALLQRERAGGEERAALIICPTSVLSNWEHEAARFTPELTCYVHHGPDRPHGEAFTEQARAHAVVLTSYALLQRDVRDLTRQRWSGFILDEAQNIKNPDTKQAQAARSVDADYRVALTGTPVENHVGDLWSIMDFLNPGFLGTQDEFKRAFLVPIQTNRDPVAADRLRRMTHPFILRRLKTDRSIISDLPEKLEMKVYCSLTREQGELYEEIVADVARKLEQAQGIARHGVILAALTRLKQVCNHPAHLRGDGSPLPGRSGKLTRLTEMIEELLAAGDRSVIFTQFAEMGTLLQAHLQDRLDEEVLYLHGGTPKNRRDAMVARFQSEGDAPSIFVLSLKAGGLGLNLTAANHVFHFDRWWNPAVENQATDRVFRIGQQRRVQVHKFVCAGTLEERIDAMIERKRSIAEDIVGTGEQWITELSDDEIHQMLALERSAIRE